MDRHHFARITRALTSIPSRREVVRDLAAAGLGLGLARAPHGVESKQRNKNKKKVKRNAFGCVDVGKLCKTAEQCCSGICQGKKGKKQCRAHNTSTCTAADDACDDSTGDEVPCGTDGVCFLTTGKASFCGGEGECVACAKDTDCEPAFGPGAACIVCVDCEGDDGSNGLACVPAAA